MFPAPFAYERPTSVEEAVAALEDEDARLLAGGHSLLTAVKARALTPGTLVDVSGLPPLVGIDRDEQGLRFGAATTYATVLADDRVQTNLPMLADALAAIGDPQIRNRGTVGGNLVQADPGADLPAVALAGGATLTIVDDDGERTRALSECYPADDGPDHEPAGDVDGDAVVTAVRFPESDATGEAYVRRTHPATGYASVGIAARLWTDGETVEDLRLAATGLHRRPRRLAAAEAAARERPVGDAASLADAHAAEDVDADDVRGDPNVSGAHRYAILGAVTAAAIDRAVEVAR